MRILSKDKQEKGRNYKRAYQKNYKYYRHPNPIGYKKEVFQCAHNFSKVEQLKPLKQDIVINPNLAAWLKTS